jgi:hypothetical protein
VLFLLMLRPFAATEKGTGEQRTRSDRFAGDRAWATQSLCEVDRAANDSNCSARQTR